MSDANHATERAETPRGQLKPSVPLTHTDEAHCPQQETSKNTGHSPIQTTWQGDLKGTDKIIGGGKRENTFFSQNEMKLEIRKQKFNKLPNT